MIKIDWENDRPEVVDRLFHDSVGHIAEVNGLDVMIVSFDGSDLFCRRWQSEEGAPDMILGKLGRLLVFSIGEIETVRFY